MLHAFIQTADGPLLVGADLQPVPETDVDVPTLHLLPSAFVPFEPLMAWELAAVTLCATSDALARVDERFARGLPLRVRQPYPNRRYLVGGTDEERVGFLVPVPADIRNVDVTFEWRFLDDGAFVNPYGSSGFAVVRHRFELALVKTPLGNVFTMDARAWPVERPASLDLIGEPADLYAALRAGRRITVPAEAGTNGSRACAAHDCAGDRSARAGQRAETATFIEQAVLRSTSRSRVWAIDAFASEQLHELDATMPAADDAITARHRAMTDVVMPASVLVRAVELAQSEDFGDDDTAYASYGAPGKIAWERHPAIRAIAEWWNTNAPETVQCAGTFYLHARPNGTSTDYWAGYHETPPWTDALDPTTAAPAACEKPVLARVGDYVLLEFLVSAEHCDWPDGPTGFWQTYYVDGSKGPAVGVAPSDRPDESWSTLVALAAFPERFPLAWGALLDERALELAQRMRFGQETPNDDLADSG